MKKGLIVILACTAIAGAVIVVQYSTISRTNHELVATRVAIHEALKLAQDEGGKMAISSVNKKGYGIVTRIRDVFPSGKITQYVIFHDGSVTVSEFQTLTRVYEKHLRDTTFAWNAIEKFE